MFLIAPIASIVIVLGLIGFYLYQTGHTNGFIERDRMFDGPDKFTPGYHSSIHPSKLWGPKNPRLPGEYDVTTGIIEHKVTTQGEQVYVLSDGVEVTLHRDGSKTFHYPKSRGWDKSIYGSQDTPAENTMGPFTAEPMDEGRTEPDYKHDNKILQGCLFDMQNAAKDLTRQLEAEKMDHELTRLNMVFEFRKKVEYVDQIKELQQRLTDHTSAYMTDLKKLRGKENKIGLFAPILVNGLAFWVRDLQLGPIEGSYGWVLQATLDRPAETEDKSHGQEI